MKSLLTRSVSLLATFSVVSHAFASDPSPKSSPPSANETLYITALTNYADPPYLARLQCWALTTRFTVYPTVGRALALGDVDNATYVVLPPRSGEGWHRPPHAMFFVLLSGVAQVYVPRRDGGGRGFGESSPPSQRNQHQRQQQNYLATQSPPRPHPTDPRWDTITITPGSAQQILVAADTDTRARGHLTFYPGDGDSVALQIPFRDGVVPAHTVVHEGACK
ncbi:hypothetical protein AYO21_04157 [Fonsecaea monophora]|uniref:Cupin type-1 domain-containing protein n=1 Tax=Fonsecaea monophora TaxID=254056 RepID=A0A177FBM1_9EURO|nr:hypothetical protein AYO21_04157 [Fonsecaea monophora]KAH0844917.1 hypothetical protein FOPE_09932 [Fonsecaea pedrosoi]OAG41693.1 hypothetical protein AYO21_04157 [Fonsecaea monophora]